MNKEIKSQSIRALLEYLLNKKIFTRHKPEKKVLNFKTKWLSKEDKKEFEKEYKELINEMIILREKKRTGKGEDWHIRLNPRKLKEVGEKLKVL